VRDRPAFLLTLEAYTAADLAAVRALHALAFTQLAAAAHSPAQIAAHAALVAAPAYAVDLAASNLMLARAPDGRLVATSGWIAVAEAPMTARIRKVFVRPDQARRGIASFMVADAERRARLAGHRHIIVRANLNAVPLYVKLGYRIVSQGEMAAPGGVSLQVRFMEKV
jgi:GNAT superfamily N-acetyltransferase